MGVPVGRMDPSVVEEVVHHLSQTAAVADQVDLAIHRRRRSARSGSTARAASAASPAIAPRSTGSRSSGRPWSSRANNRRSSTSTPMRDASASIRAIDFSRSSGRVPAPRRNSSAYPLIDVKGVRNSCDASATNRRRRSSDARRSSNAASMWVSIALSASPRRPTSVRSSAGETRWLRSPAAIDPAVSPMPLSGFSPSRTNHSARAAVVARTAIPTATSMRSSRRNVACTSVEWDGDQEGAAVGQGRRHDPVERERRHRPDVVKVTGAVASLLEAGDRVREFGQLAAGDSPTALLGPRCRRGLGTPGRSPAGATPCCREDRVRRARDSCWQRTVERRRTVRRPDPAGTTA